MEKTIEIPLGAKDSELKGWEYTIPENMEAEIKDGKIIVREKESEDEKIRKDLITFICQFAPEHLKVQYVAYLEKQKEQKPASGNSEKPNNHAEWSEDWREEDIQTRFAFYTYKDDPSVLYLSNVFVEEASRNHGFGTRILRAAEKVAEAIGATTISLKVKQDSPANAWYRKNGYGYVTFEDGYDWLEKNLEYLKPKQKEQKPESCDCSRDEESYTNGIHHVLMNPEAYGLIKLKPAKWSEEFLRLMGITISQDGNQVCVLLGENLAEGIAGFGDTLADAVEEFKKEWRQFDRFRKATWKPSEEQMKEYSYWYKNFIESGLASPSSKAVNVLGELLEQLKKL